MRWPFGVEICLGYVYCCSWVYVGWRVERGEVGAGVAGAGDVAHIVILQVGGW